MKGADEEKLLEATTWMGGLAGVDDESVVRVRSWFCVAEYTPEDFRELSETLLDAGATAGFAVCARDIDEQAEIIEELDDAGHEIVFHGNRHTAFADLDYGTAHGYIETGLDRIEDASGVRPTGFFVPWMTASEGALRAAADLGIEWMYADPEGNVPDSIEIVDPVMPADSIRLENGADPAEMMDTFVDAATDGASFLFHPPFLEYYDGVEAFEQWIRDIQPVSVREQRDHGGVGIVLDCIRPMRLE